jgi:hypothetical protein
MAGPRRIELPDGGVLLVKSEERNRAPNVERKSVGKDYAGFQVMRTFGDRLTPSVSPARSDGRGDQADARDPLR